MLGQVVAVAELLRPAKEGAAAERRGAAELTHSVVALEICLVLMEAMVRPTTYIRVGLVAAEAAEAALMAPEAMVVLGWREL
jgi:hypothetical protein